MKRVQKTSGRKKGKEKENERIERFIRSITSRNNIVKERAAKSLLRSPPRGIVPRLNDLLRGKEAGPRMAALELLKKFDSSAVGPVIDLLHDKDPAVRIRACEILASLGHAKARPHLLVSLKDESPNVRSAACLALGEFRGDQVVEGLLDALNDEEWIAFSAIYSLGRIASFKIMPQLWKIVKEREGVLPLIACEVLIAFKDRRVLQDLFATLKGWSEEKRDIFIRTILEKEDAPTLDQLHESMGEALFEHLARFIAPDTGIPMKLMKLVARFQRQEACDIILDALSRTGKDGDDFDKMIELFANLKPVWSSRVAYYLGKDSALLLPFIRACGVTGQKIPEESLCRLFSEAPLDLRREIIRQLPDILSHGGATLLKKALYDEDGHVKGDAALASARLRLDGLAPEILDLAKVGFLDVRRKALQALTTLDVGRATALAESFVAQGSGEDKKVAVTAMDHLDKDRSFKMMKALLADPQEAVKRSAIYAAGRLLEKDTRYLEILNRLLVEQPVPHELLRVVRERRLYTFKDQLVLLFLDAGRDSWTRYEVLAGLAVFQDQALFEVFVNGLRDENTLIKIGSIKALSDLGDPAAIRYVKAFTQSQDITLRSVAGAAVKQLKQREREAAR
jgi:HEAT repeat protein